MHTSSSKCLTALTALVGALVLNHSPARAEYICFDYGYSPNVANYSVYDTFVLEPYPYGKSTKFKTAQAAGKKFYAYISATEIAMSAHYYAVAVLEGVPFISQNPQWDSMVVDQTDPRWATFVIEYLARRIVSEGYDGFFLDTMDSYYLTPDSGWAAQELGLINMVKQLKAAFPDKKIMTNRGFPLYNRTDGQGLKGTIDSMLVEGLLYSHGGSPQDTGDTIWLLDQLKHAKAAGLPIYILDYLGGGTPNYTLANEVANNIQRWGFTACVMRQDLDGNVLAPRPGVSTVVPLKLQVLPKNVLRFNRAVNAAYTIEYRDSLAANWSPLRNFAASAQPPVTIDYVDSSARLATTRFYRLKAQY